MADQTNSAMLGQASGVNANLAALVGVLRSAFPLHVSTGVFTLSAAATKVVSDTNVKAGSLIFWSCTNASAGTLEGSANKLYLSAIVAGTSFTVATAAGTNAAGTETFAYFILNAG